MLISGILVPIAYLKFLNNQEFRPPFEKGLGRNIQLLDDKRGVISLGEFDSGIWLAYCTSSQEKNENSLIHKKVSDLRKRFPNTDIKACIFLVDASENEPEKLTQYRISHPTLADADYIVAAKIPVVQKYLKNEFRFSVYPYEKEDRWIYDYDLIILDNLPQKEKTLPNALLCHMRGHLNFKRAQEIDQEAIKNNSPMAAEQRLDELFVKTIQYLIDNPAEESAPLQGDR